MIPTATYECRPVFCTTSIRAISVTQARARCGAAHLVGTLLRVEDLLPTMRPRRSGGASSAQYIGVTARNPHDPAPAKNLAAMNMPIFRLPHNIAPPNRERRPHHMKPALRPHLSATQPAMKTLMKAPAYVLVSVVLFLGMPIIEPGKYRCMLRSVGLPQISGREELW